MLRKILVFLSVVSAMSLPVLSLTGCNTVEGAGKDVSRAGAAVQEEAREHKSY